MIDRVEPSRRPTASASGYQHWRSLLFLHWPVPIAALRPLVPQSLSLDLYEGVAYVGVVPFLMRKVRPKWWPKPFAFNFLETNVRTYVHHDGRPGVYFFSLEADSRMAVWAARKGWGLPYHYAHMSYVAEGDEISFRSRRARTGEEHKVRYQIAEHLGPSEVGTIEHFLLERYLLFAERGDRMLVGQVHHTPYVAKQAIVHDLADDLVAAAGLERPTQPPCLAHYSESVDVEVFSLRECRPRAIHFRCGLLAKS